MSRKQIWHSQKKSFSAKLFALLMDFSNDKIWSAADAKSLNDLVQQYSKIDKNFVRRSITHYEQKTGQKYELALMAARSSLV